MRLSKLLFRTFKEVPAEAELTSHQLLERGGFIKKAGKGIFIYSPMMWRVLQKVMGIIREEMNKAGAQEINLPLLHPAELWHASGRWDDFVAEKTSFTLTDREGHNFLLAPTHEEMVTFLVSNWVTSYKHLPLNLYQMGHKFRDEIRPRFGLMRSKDFLMKDGYSFSDSPTQMEKQYESMRTAYSQVFKRLKLDFVIVQAHGGKIGQGKSEEFQVKADVGEDVILMAGDFAINVETAHAKPLPFSYDTEIKPLQEIETPQMPTIEALSKGIGIEPAQILKCLIYKLIFADKEEFVMIAVRGDREVNGLKIATKFGAAEAILATEQEAKELTGASFGFIGPFNSNLPFYADLNCKKMTNFMAAHNKDHWHMNQVNWERDLPHPDYDDYLLAEAGDECPSVPGERYQLQRGIEVGHIFNLGTKYSQSLNAHFQTAEGETKPFQMGTYGIGIGRSVSAVIEQHHDDKGIVWPHEIAPFKVVITVATTKSETLVHVAEALYQSLEEAKLEPLLDDRAERLGLKLKDADLIGIPYKIIVGKTFENEGKFEIESRLGEKMLLTNEEVIPFLKENLQLTPISECKCKL